MFSTFWNTQRFTELGREERREGEDRGNLVEKKVSPKGERTSYPVITYLCVLHSLDPSEMFTELHREEKREEGERSGQEDKGGIKRRETDPASNQFPNCSPQPRTPREIQS